MPGRVFLDGYMDLPLARRDAVLAALPAHIALTRAEAGCLSFEAVPDPDGAARLLVAEIFADRGAFDAHQARAAASPWADVTAGLARHYTIRVED